MTVFWAGLRDLFSNDGITCGSLIDYENQKDFRKMCSPPPWRSRAPSRSDWVHVSFSGDCGWTIHLPEQKETIHMISILRKKACSRSIHDLARIPNQKLLGRLFHKGSSQGGQSDHNREDKKIAGICLSP